MKKAYERTDLMCKAWDLELTLALQEAMCGGYLRMVDATPTSVTYYVTFWYHKDSLDPKDDKFCKLICNLACEGRIFVILNEDGFNSESLLENVRDAIRRNKSVTRRLVFRVDMEDQEAVLVEVKSLLATPMASTP